MKIRNVVLLLTLMAAGTSMAGAKGACMTYVDDEWKDSECMDGLTFQECIRLFDYMQEDEPEGKRPTAWSWFGGLSCWMVRT